MTTVGDRIAGPSFGPISRQTLVEWCAAENDYYDLHYDEQVAEAMGMPGTPVQGTLKFALLGETVATWAGPGAVIESIGVSYRGVDLRDDTVTPHGEVRAFTDLDDGGQRIDLALWTENQRGERSTEGTAVVRLPG